MTEVEGTTDHNDPAEVLAALRPRQAAMVMNLVDEAGIDVSSWRVTQNGKPVENPAANPAFCYEWSFGGEDEPIALCVWHRDAKVADQRIVYEDNLRRFATDLDQVGYDPKSPRDVSSRARTQAKRGRAFDSAIQAAFYKSMPVRVILLVGDDAVSSKLGWDTSKVRCRAIDTMPWHVEHYDYESGNFRLGRGLATGTPQPHSDSSTVAPSYADQYSIPPSPERVATTGSALPRSPEVRSKVLARAAGICELCRQAGFQMANGAIYLETHHVIPISDNGPDVEWNVVAICPNDHRRAHFSADRDQIRSQLIGTLIEAFPRARDALFSLGNANIGQAKG